MATVIIPTPLRKFTNQAKSINVNGNSVAEAFDELVLNYPDLKKNLLDENGQLREFVNVFVGDNDIRDLQQSATAVKDGTVISIIPAIAGGVN
jgi:molybdopterin converting factor small subunit